MQFKKIKKIIIAAVILSGNSLTLATGTGFYLGAQLGESNTNNITRPVQTNTVPASTVDVTPSNTGIAGRVFVGYAINQYAAFEGGFTHYGSSTYDAPNPASCGNPTIRENGFDLVGKGSYPISDFALYAKAGAAFVRTSLAGSLAPLPTISACSDSSSTTTYIRPIAGIGASYDFSPNWVADVSYSHVFKGGDFQNIDFIALGVSYHFVDKYCGQFLC